MKGRYVVGAALRALRVQKQMRQKDLADLAAVVPQHLCRIENDADYCSDITAVRLARALDCDVSDFTAIGKHPNIATWRRKVAAA